MTSTELKTHPVTKDLQAIQERLALKDRPFAQTLRLGFDGANWGKILKGTYDGSHTKMLIRLQVALDSYHNPETTETEEGVVIFKHVQDALNAMKIAVARSQGGDEINEHRCVIIAGPKGSGKTRTIRICDHRFPGCIMEALPSWSGSYFDFLTQFATGLEMKVDAKRSKGAYELAILDELKQNPRPIFIDELNYFSASGFNFLKSILNKTRASIMGATIPRYLTQMSTGATAQEFAQLLRRTVAICHIPPVTEREIFQIQKAFRPEIEITAAQAIEIAKESNTLAYIDSARAILDACKTAADVSKAISVHKRSKQTTLNHQAA